MQTQVIHFKKRVAKNLANPRLQATFAKTKGNFIRKRAKAIQELENFEPLREAAAIIRDRVLHNLDEWLELFEREAIRRGAQVFWAKDGNEANQLIINIAKEHRVKKIIKSKSMLSEEAGLNRALAAAHLDVIETDLGEYILQINNNEPPSHIIAPAVHKNLEEISELFTRVHNLPRTTSIPSIISEVRQILRSHFLSADMGLSGGNFLIAETGSVALVTNEGNGRMVTTLPRVHVAMTGIEKIVPTLEDLAALMRLLPRSATGQSVSNYFSLLTGVRGKSENEGPEHRYFILVDSGRSDLLGTDFEEILRCIRCGACMNHCPVYTHIGGHAYGWVYPGPMGSVLTPLYIGIEQALDLPNAATLCGECEVVCPVKIPLPHLMRKLREKQIEQKLRSWRERGALQLWEWCVLHPKVYAFVSRALALLLSWWGGSKKYISYVPFASAWTRYRDLPTPERKTFRDQYKKNEANNELS